VSLRGRRGGALLLALAIGALIVGGVATAAATLRPAATVPISAAASVRPAPPPAPPLRLLIPGLPELPDIPLPPVPSKQREPARRPAGPAAEVVALTNRERGKAGCRALAVDRRLAAAAQRHSENMAEQDFFSHSSPDGRGFVDRIRAAGHPSPGAENIARGQTSAREVVADWMDSPGHRRNILDCGLTAIGVGFDERGYYWTQDFGR
jgi:uncharacterized protein YkwD